MGCRENKLLITQRDDMYTAQVSAFGIYIVCKGGEIRNGYKLVYAGTYKECLWVANL